MGATYTRQSTYNDGDTITSDHTNDEFDQLLAAFASSTGHSHDGTTAEGGPITKLLGTSITIGDATSGTDITVTFDGESNDGVLKWMEDEDYFEFSDDILIATTEKIQFRDTGIYINSSADGQLDLVADTEIQIAATTIDMNGAVDISGNLGIGGNLVVTGTTTFNGGTLTLGASAADNVVFGSNVDSSIIPDDDDTYDLGSASQQWRNIFIDGTAEVDTLSIDGTAVTSTAAELNILDGVTSTATEINLLDGVTSTTAELNILDGVTSTAAELNVLDGITAVVGELNALDLGDTAIGTAVASKAVVLDANKDSTGIRNLTLTGNLTIPNDGLFAATNTAGNILVADGTNFNSTAVSSLSEISTAANDDVFLAIDTSGGGLKKITRSTVLAGTGSSTDLANVVEDTTPQLGGNLDMNGADIVTTSNATIDLAPNGTGTVVVRGNTNSGAIVFNCESNSHGQKVIAQPHSASVTNTMLLPAGANSTLVSLVSTDTLTNKTLTSPKINEDVAVTSTATELNILDGVTSTTAELNILDGVTSTAAELNILDGVTSTAAELNILDGVTSTTAEINLIDGGTARGTTAVADGDGVLINDAGTMRMTSVDTLSTYMSGKSVGGTGIVTTGALDAGSITSGFGTIDTGASAITTTGLISGGSLDIDSVLINGATIGHTDDTDLMTVADGILTVAGEVQMTTLDIGGTNVTSTAAELNILDGVTSTAAELNILDGVTSTAAELNVLDGITAVVGELNALDIGSTAVGTAVASKAVILDSNKDYAGMRNVTTTGLFKPVTYQETYIAKSAASTVTCDLATGTHFSVTIAANTTFAFSNPPSSGTAYSFILIITQHSTAVTLTWPNTVDWAGGSAPAAAGNNEVQAYGFITRDGGTTYYGFLGGTAIA